MSFLQGVFGGGNNGNQARPGGTGVQQPTPGNQPNNTQQQNPNPQGSGGGAGPAGAQTEHNANSQVNPLDSFMQLMTPSKEVNDANKLRQDANSKGLFGDQFNADNIGKAVGGIDFTQGVNPELVTKALGGDAAAFSEYMNSVIRNAVSASVQMSHGMVEKGVSTGVERFGGDLDSRFRDFTLRNQNVENPALQHPMGKAMLQSLSKQIAAANPRMSPDEVHKQAVSGFSEFAKMLVDGNAPKDGAGGSGGKKADMDWNLFLDGQQQEA